MGAAFKVNFQDSHYNPETGRFLSEDPIGFLGGDVNLYWYVGNNPVNEVDSSGEGPLLANACLVALVVEEARLLKNFAEITKEVGNLSKQLKKAQSALDKEIFCDGDVKKIETLNEIIERRRKELESALKKKVRIGQKLTAFTAALTRRRLICNALRAVPGS